MYRLAQATYRTPSTAATGPDGISPAAASFQGFACSPVSDQASPLATFLHHLSHATYEAAPAAGTTPSFAAAPSTAAVAAELAGKEDKPEAQAAVPADAANNDVQQVDSTPYQDFMKFLTQATYHSPGTKCDAGSQGLPLRPQAVQSNNLKQHEQGSISGTPDVRPLTVRTGRSTTVAVTPCKYAEALFGSCALCLASCKKVSAFQVTPFFLMLSHGSHAYVVLPLRDYHTL